MATTLVMHFNAFTGKLEGGYLRTVNLGLGQPICAHHSEIMTPRDVIVYLAAHPEVSCHPLMV